MKQNYFGVILLCLLLASQEFFAQRNGVMEAPCGAINLSCNPYYESLDAFSGTYQMGRYSTGNKYNGTILNNVFFRFKAAINGNLNFLITPAQTYDYDYYIYEIPSNANACENISTNLDLSNYIYVWHNEHYETDYDHRLTGSNQTTVQPGCGAASSCAFNKEIPVQAGKEYMIILAFYHGGIPTTAACTEEGFIFDATKSTPGLFASVIDYTVSASKTTICSGSSTNLSINTIETDVEYTWTAPGEPTQSGSNITVSPTSTKTYTVTAVKKGSTCASTVKTITINVTPPFTVTLSSNKTKICAGETISLTATGAPANSTYSFGGAGINSSNNNTAIATPPITNSYMVTVSNPNTVCVATASVNVQVDAPLNFNAKTSNYAICAGGSATLQSSTFSNNGNYVWNGGSLVNASGATQIVTPSSSTTYTLTASDPSNACVSSSKVQVNVIDLASVSITGNLDSCGGGQLCAQAPTSKLVPGDIAILRYRMDPTYEFTFVNLVPLPIGTVINFTDGAWNENTQNLDLNAGDKIVSYTATYNIPAGTNITLSASYNWDFSSAGDQIIAFQGTQNNPNFIYALSTTPWLKTGTPNASNSYLPKGLVNAQSAIEFKIRRKNGKFSSALSYTGTNTNFLFEVSNFNNWTISNSVTFPVANTTPVGDPTNYYFTFTNSATPGILWNTGATTNCINIFSDGVYDVTYTEPHGCSSTASKNIISDRGVNWATYLGSSTNIVSTINTSNNNLVVCGVLNGQVFPTNVNTNIYTYGTGNYGVFVAEINKAGDKIIKLIQYKMSSLTLPISNIKSIAIDASNNYIIGGNINGNASGFVLKLNSIGQFTWQKNLDFMLYKTDVYLNKIAIVGNSNAGTAADMKFMIIQSSTNTIANNTFGGNAYDAALSVTHDNSGNFYVCGVMVSYPNSLSNAELISKEVINSSVKGAEDATVFKFTNTGTLVNWTRMGSSLYDYWNGVAWSNNKLYLIGTQNANGSNIFSEWITVLNSNTLQLQQELLNTSGAVQLNDVKITSANQLWILGSTTIPSNTLMTNPFQIFSGDNSGYYHDLAIAKLNINTLATEWSTYWGAANINTAQSEIASNLAIDAQNTVYVTGFCFGNQFNVKTNKTGTILKNTTAQNDGIAIKIACTDSPAPTTSFTTSVASAKENSNWLAYPNPFNDVLFLNTQNSEVAVKVYSIDGKLIEQSYFSQNSEITLGHNWQDGVYFICVIGENRSENFKVIKHN